MGRRRKRSGASFRIETATHSAGITCAALKTYRILADGAGGLPRGVFLTHPVATLVRAAVAISIQRFDWQILIFTPVFRWLHQTARPGITRHINAGIAWIDLQIGGALAQRARTRTVFALIIPRACVAVITCGVLSATDTGFVLLGFRRNADAVNTCVRRRGTGTTANLFTHPEPAKVTLGDLFTGLGTRASFVATDARA